MRSVTLPVCLSIFLSSEEERQEREEEEGERPDSRKASVQACEHAH